MTAKEQAILEAIKRIQDEAEKMHELYASNYQTDMASMWANFRTGMGRAMGVAREVIEETP